MFRKYTLCVPLLLFVLLGGGSGRLQGPSWTFLDGFCKFPKNIVSGVSEAPRTLLDPPGWILDHPKQILNHVKFGCHVRVPNHWAT